MRKYLVGHTVALIDAQALSDLRDQNFEVRRHGGAAVDRIWADVERLARAAVLDEEFARGIAGAHAEIARRTTLEIDLTAAEYEELWAAHTAATSAARLNAIEAIIDQRAALALLSERSPRGYRARRHARRAADQLAARIGEGGVWADRHRPRWRIHGWGPGWRALPSVSV